MAVSDLGYAGDVNECTAIYTKYRLNAENMRSKIQP